MRLFTALDLPPDMLLTLQRLLSALRPEAPIKWSPLDNLHITIKFIGDWPEARLEDLDAAIQPLRFRAPFDIRLQHLGWFPNAHSPRVLRAGVDGGAALTALAHQTETAILGLGVGKDPHTFSPHLTLARIKARVPLQRLRARVEDLKTLEIGTCRAANFFLYRSDPGSHASIYRKIRTYPLELKSSN